VNFSQTTASVTLDYLVTLYTLFFNWKKNYRVIPGNRLGRQK